MKYSSCNSQLLDPILHFKDNFDGPKPVHQRQYDESNAQFMRSVPPDKRDQYTLMSGSSQAAAQVSRAAAQMIHFVQNAARQKGMSSDGGVFSLTMPRARWEAGADQTDRYAGVVVSQNEQTVEVAYRLVEPWRLVKQLLMDTALPMPGYARHEVGAGFVSPVYVEEQFGAFGVPDGKQLLPIKVE